MLQQLHIPEKICLYHSWAEAAKELHFTGGDAILTTPLLAKKHLDPASSDFRILTADPGSSNPCRTKTLISLQKQLPNDTKRLIVWGSPALLRYGRLLYTDRISCQTPPSLYLIPSQCDAGSEMLTRVALEHSSDHTVSEVLTAPADYICLCSEPPHPNMIDTFIAGTIDTLIYASETFIHEKATNHTLLFSREALRLLIESYRNIVFRNIRLESGLCETFLLAGNYTGIAREQINESLLEPVFQSLPDDVRGNCHVRLLLFIHLFRRRVFTSTTGRIQEYLSYMSSLLDCSRSNVYPELLNLVKCVLPPSGETNLPTHLSEIEKLVHTYPSSIQ